MKRFLPIVAMAALTACSSATKSSDAYALASALTAADRVALGYMTLPTCTGATPVCSDPAVKQKIKVQAQIAYDAVKQAEAGDSAAVVAARTAINVLVATIPSVKVQ